ncbi:MAG: hypothetical protein ACI9MU_000004 [Alphaproteobacteria bacterium]|jgi:hypothetical protein
MHDGTDTLRPLRAAGALIAVLTMAALSVADGARAAGGCGEIVTLKGHDDSTVEYTHSGVSDGAKAALVLLPGGGGFLKLDHDGCPRKLKGNSLVRSQALFHKNGFVTALADAPSDRQGKAGLGGFRIRSKHADDIGKVISDVRERTGLPVWLIGTSRGAISAANAASRLSGTAAPDGLVLTSPVTSGFEGGRKRWVAQTVFSNDLDAIRMPVLVVVHEADKCIRTPPILGPRVIRKTNTTRGQAVTVSGGPGLAGGESVKACKGRSPHGFLGQEAEVIAGISRFVLGGKF